MATINDFLSDEASSASNQSFNQTESTDLNDLLNYQGNIGGGGGSSSQRTSSARNGAYHDRQTLVGALSFREEMEEEDLLDQFFNAAQEYICKQQKIDPTSERRIRVPKSTVSRLPMGFSGVSYKKDMIDLVFENVENVTCDQPHATGGSSNEAQLHDTLERLHTLGNSVHLKLYGKDPKAVQKRVDEWLADTFQEHNIQNNTDLNTGGLDQQRETASHFTDLFFRRIETFNCLPKAPEVDEPLQEAERDDKDTKDDAIKHGVSAEMSEAQTFQRSDRSSPLTPSNQISRSPSLLLMSPTSTANSTFSTTPPGIECQSSAYASVASESDCSQSTFSVGSYSYSEHSSPFAQNVISPRSERSERTEYSQASYTEHTHGNHSDHTTERDNRALLSSSTSQEDEEGEDEDDPFDVVSRPLFVIKEEMSATESMISERGLGGHAQLQKLSAAGPKGGCCWQNLSSYSDFHKNPNKQYSFRYSSAHYRFNKKACKPEAAAHAAQDWVEQFKYAVEVTIYRLTTALQSVDADVLCSASSAGKQDMAKDSAAAVRAIDDRASISPVKPLSSVLGLVQERVATENVGSMCHGQMPFDHTNDVETPAEDVRATCILGCADRSRFASVSLMPSLDEEDGIWMESCQSNENTYHSLASFVSNDNTYHTVTSDDNPEMPRMAQEPPEQIQETSEPPIARQRAERGRDPEPSVQLKLDGYHIVGGPVSNEDFVPQTLSDRSDPEQKYHEETLKSPRSSETEKTAELTAVTSDTSQEGDLEKCSESVKAQNADYDNMIVCLPESKQTSRITTFYSHENRMEEIKKHSRSLSFKETSTNSTIATSTQSNTFHTALIFSIFDEEDDQTNYSSEATCQSYPSEMDLRTSCTDIVVYEKKPDFFRLWFDKDAEHPISPWQLVVYVAWLSVSFLVRVNGEVHSHLLEKKKRLFAILENEDPAESQELSRTFTRDTLDAVPSIDYQLSLG